MENQTKNTIDTESSLRRKVEGAFSKLCQSVSYSPDRVFDDLLEFIVHGFCLNAGPMKEWKYTPEQTAAFKEMFSTLVLSMQEILQTREWYDFLGGIYEMQVAGKWRKSGCGQFFTPISVCDFMAAITAPDAEKSQESISDPCSGSGRTLLAGHAHNPRAFLYAMDLDRTCCMMTLVNFLMHGCSGRVIHGDSLKNEAWEAWAVNPQINMEGSALRGIPHIVKLVVEKAA